MIQIFKKLVFFIFIFPILFSSCKEKKKGESNYRIEYWITDYHRKQIIPNILIDTIFDEDILVKTKWIQINKSNLDDITTNSISEYIDFNDSISCSIPEILNIDYENNIFIKNIVFWTKNGGSVIIDITYDPEKGVIMKYYPEYGFELLLKRFYYENDKLVKVEDFHDLQERNKSYNEDFYYRK